MNVDLMVKVGGSLLNNIEYCRQLVEAFEALNEMKKMIIFPGGGDIDNYIEQYSAKQKLGKIVMHKSTMLALDQNALILSSYSKKVIPFTSVIECREILKEGKIPVFMPSQATFILDPFRYNSTVSSDSMALYFSKLFEVKELILLKSIDGILDKHSEVIKEISIELLQEIEQDCVDPLFPYLAAREQVPIMILNGRSPDVLNDYVIHGKFDLGTKIR